MGEDKNDLDVMLGIVAACGRMTTQEQLAILEITWLCVASNARTEALINPDGFPAERMRQVEQLRKMAYIIAADQPDLEMEQLFHGHDWAGMAQHLQRRLSDGEKGGA